MDELADEALPVVAAHVGADAVGAELVVPEAQDLLALGAAQDVDDVRDAEALPQPVDAAQRHLRVLGGVVGLGGVEADVAVAAVGAGYGSPK